MANVSPNILYMTANQDHWDIVATRLHFRGATVTRAQTFSSVLHHLEDVNATKKILDLIILDVLSKNDDWGFLVEQLRRLPRTYSVAGGVCIRNLPIILTIESDNESPYTIGIGTYIVPKPMNFRKFEDTINIALRAFRHALLAHLQKLSLALTWQDGRLRLVDALLAPISSDWLALGSSKIDELRALEYGYQRLILLTAESGSAEADITAFESLINDDRTTERDLHAFFELHPEFLLRNHYGSYYSEPRLRSLETGEILRPDFILQPLAQSHVPWKWELIELKRASAPLVVNKRFHSNYSSHVMAAVRQLRDYQQFFADPRNSEELRHRFGGIAPQPRLTALIGRLRDSDIQHIKRLRVDVSNDVDVLTYDDILQYRRASLSTLRTIDPTL